MGRIDELYYDIDVRTRDAERRLREVSRVVDQYELNIDHAASATSRARRASDEHARSTKRQSDALKSQQTILQRLGARVLTFIGTWVGLQQVGRLIRFASAELLRFDTAMGQVATLTEATGAEFRLLEERVQGVSGALPKTADDLGFGLYQTLSAGITDTSEAMFVLEESAKLASAGLLDTQSSVGALTTILNAYGLEASRAADVSDSLFTVVERGVITVPLLAQHIGQVATSAALAGVEIEELGAAISTLTRSGVRSEMTMSSLNRLFLGIVNPTDASTEAARRLGIEWSKAGLEARGLAGFLRDLQETTLGDVQTLGELGLTLEGARALFVLAGEGAQGFEEDLARQRDRAGATDRALRDVNETLGAQAQIIRNRLSVALANLADTVLPRVLRLLGEFTELLESDFDRRIRRLQQIGGQEGLIAQLIREDEIRRANDALAETRDRLDELGFGVGQAAKELRLEGQLALATAEAERLNVAIQDIENRLGLTVGEATRLAQTQDGLATRGVALLVNLDRQLRAAEEQAALAKEGLELLVTEQRLIERVNDLQEQTVEIQRDRVAATEEEILQFRQLARAAELAANEVLESMTRIKRGVGDAPDLKLPDPFAITASDIVGGVRPTRSFGEAEGALAQIAARITLLARLNELFVNSSDQVVEVERVLTELLTSGNDEMMRRGEFLERNLQQFRDLFRAVSELRGAETALARARSSGTREQVAQAEVRLRAALEGVGAALRSTTDDMDDSSDSTRDLADRMEELAALSRGILSLADAFGVLDDDLRKTLEGATELATSIASIASTGPNVGNVLGAIGGATQLISGIAGLLSGGGDEPRETPQQRAAREAQAENTAALRRLAETVQRLADGLLEVPFTAVGEALEAAQREAEARNRQVQEALDALPEDAPGEQVREISQGFVSLFEQLQIVLARMGLTMDDVRSVAETLGLEWDGTAVSMNRLIAALAEIDLTESIVSFFETFEGQLSLLRREFELFDIDDPIEQMRRLLGVVGQFTAIGIPDFDLSTPEGRAALDEFIQSLFNQLRGGAPQDLLDQLGTLSGSDLLDLLTEIERLSDAVGGTTAGVGEPTFTRNVQITEAQAGRLLAMTASQVTRLDQMYELAVARNHLLEMIAGLEAGPGGSLVGGISVTVNGPFPGVTDETRAQEIGSTLGLSLAESLDRELQRRQTNSSRAVGG